MRERIERERSRCDHPGVRLGDPPRCYLCLKRGLGLIAPRSDTPVSNEEELGFVGVLNGHGSAPSGWVEAESILAAWGEVGPHPIERRLSWPAKKSVSLPTAEEAEAEIEELMGEPP
jgi:hypothetical protein